MPLPLVLATPTVINGVAIAATALVVGYQINQSLSQDIGLPSSSASGLPESPVWDGLSTGTGLLENKLADSRKQALRDTYQPLVGSPPLAPPSQSAPKSSSVPTPRAAERVQDRLSPQLGSINDLFTQGQAFVNSIAATIPSPNNQKFPNFGVPNPFSFDNPNEDNGYYQDASRVDSQKPEPIYTPPFTGGQSAGIDYLVTLQADWRPNYASEPIYKATSTVRGAVSMDRFSYSGYGYTYSAIRILSGGAQVGSFAANDSHQFPPYIVSVARKDGLTDTGGDIPNPIAAPPLSPPPVYPDAEEWPYGDINVKVGGVASSPIASLPNIASGLPNITPQETPDIAPNFDPPAIAPDGFLPSQLAPPLLAAPPQQMLLGRDSFISVPATQTPATQTPATQTPATQTPATQTPATQTPATQVFATQTPKFPQIYQDPAQGYKSGADTYPTYNTNNQTTNIYNTTNQQGTDTSGLSNQIAGVSSQVSGVSSQVSGVSSQVSGVSSQVSGVSNQISALPTIPQIAATTATAICEQSAPDGCIDNSNKRNKPTSGEQVSITIQEFDKCENGAAIFKTKTIQVLKGTEQQAQELFKQISEIEGQKCTSLTSVTTFPDSWAGKVEDDRPQAVIYYREWDGSKFGDYKHSVCIPWYSKPKGYKPSLPIIKKGSFFGILKFKDNSQIYVNCESINEAKRVINALKPLSGIKTQGAKLKLGEYGDGTLKRVSTKAVRLDFYSKGRANASPDWNVAL